VLKKFAKIHKVALSRTTKIDIQRLFMLTLTAHKGSNENTKEERQESNYWPGAVIYYRCASGKPFPRRFTYLHIDNPLCPAWHSQMNKV